MNQRDPLPARLRQRSQAMLTLMALMLVILLLQLWLVTIALEEHLAAQHELALPTFLASVGCFLLSLWLLRYVYWLDREE